MMSEEGSKPCKALDVISSRVRGAGCFCVPWVSPEEPGISRSIGSPISLDSDGGLRAGTERWGDESCISFVACTKEAESKSRLSEINNSCASLKHSWDNAYLLIMASAARSGIFVVAICLRFFPFDKPVWPSRYLSLSVKNMASIWL